MLLLLLLLDLLRQQGVQLRHDGGHRRRGAGHMWGGVMSVPAHVGGNGEVGWIGFGWD
jgi:hypothetical protein